MVRRFGTLDRPCLCPLLKVSVSSGSEGARCTMLSYQNKVRKRFRIFAIGVVVAMLATTLGAFWLFHTNELGLTGFDAMLGGFPNMALLRSNIRAAADSFLAQHKNELITRSKQIELTVDYSKVRQLGYRSSFYYYCWDIYLPYSVLTRPGETVTVVVHLSDAVHGNKHDPQKFHVLEVLELNSHGQTITTIPGI